MIASGVHLSFSVWIDGRGHPAQRVSAALRSVQGQSLHVREIVVLVDEAVVLGVALLSDTKVSIVHEPSFDELLRNCTTAERAAGWIAWLDASSDVAADAFSRVAGHLARFDVDLAYGDTVLTSGQVIHRPMFSPVRLRSQDYLGDLRFFRLAAVEISAGLRAGFAPAESYDLTLRLSVDESRVLRIPEPLTATAHGASGKLIPEQTESMRLAAADALSARGIVAEIEPTVIRYPLRAHPLVSVIIPTRGSRAVIGGSDRVLVVEAVRGILERSTWDRFEFVVVADDETPQEVIDELLALAGDRLRLVRFSESFDFSAKINRGATHARGEYLLLLNDDVELITPDWIEIMLGLASQPGIGVVGSMLLFEEGTVQHGGHLYEKLWAGHAAVGWHVERDDMLKSLAVEREVSGVTAACSLVSADLFWQVGGLSSDYPGNYNDVDFCLKVRASGRSILFTPRVRLFHFESKSRVATIVPVEIETLRRQWASRLLTDPYWTAG